MDRARNLDRLGDAFDLAIIGGGATGLGAAVEAAARGYRTVLLEARDFAQGTSSRSTKLVHGGVRYLAQGNVGLVREALLERGRLRRNAPHLVGDLEFVVPAYAWWSGPYYGVGLKLYDVLAGRHRLGTSQLLSRAQVLERIPTLEPDQLKGGVRYFDGQFDDARLAVTLALTADDLGAVLVNHASVVGLLKAGGKIRGVQVRDDESGREHEVSARRGGERHWRLRRRNPPDGRARRRGAGRAVAGRAPGPPRLVPPRCARPDDSADRRRPGPLRRPWHKRALVGTTDTPVPAGERRAAAAGGGGGIPPRARRAVPDPGPATRGRAQRLRRAAPAGPDRGGDHAPPRSAATTASSRARAAWSPSSAASGPPTGAWARTWWTTPHGWSGCPSVPRRPPSSACTGHRPTSTWSTRRQGLRARCWPPTAPRRTRCARWPRPIPTSRSPCTRGCRISCARWPGRCATRWPARWRTSSRGGRARWCSMPARPSSARRPWPGSWPVSSGATRRGSSVEISAFTRRAQESLLG